MGSADRPINNEQEIPEAFVQGEMLGALIKARGDFQQWLTEKRQGPPFEQQLTSLENELVQIRGFFSDPKTVAYLSDEEIEVYTNQLGEITSRKAELSEASARETERIGNIPDRFTALEAIIQNSFTASGGIEVPLTAAEEKETPPSETLEGDLLEIIISTENGYQRKLQEIKDCLDSAEANIKRLRQNYEATLAEMEDPLSQNRPETIRELRKIAQEIEKCEPYLAQLTDESGRFETILGHIGILRENLLISQQQGGLEKIWEKKEAPQETTVSHTEAVKDIIGAFLTLPDEQPETGALIFQEQIGRVNWKQMLGEENYQRLMGEDRNYTQKFCNAMYVVANAGIEVFDLALRRQSGEKDPRVDYAVIIDILEGLTVNDFLKVFPNYSSDPSALRILSLVHRTKIGNFVEPNNFNLLLQKIRAGQYGQGLETIGEVVEFECLLSSENSIPASRELGETDQKPPREPSVTLDSDERMKSRKDSLRGVIDWARGQINSRIEAKGGQPISWPTAGANLPRLMGGKINTTFVDQVADKRIINPEIHNDIPYYSEFDAIALLLAKRYGLNRINRAFIKELRAVYEAEGQKR